MRKLCFGLLFVFMLITQDEVHAGRAIPDDNLAYPVLVRLDTGSNGSGFFFFQHCYRHLLRHSRSRPF